MIRFSRRELLGGRFIHRLATEAAFRTVPVQRMDPEEAPARFGRGKALPLLRPPGAIAEAEFLAACTRCGDCATACPHDAIVRAPARLRQAADTPLIDPQQSPCLMCADAPCVTACEPGALDANLPRRMGEARVLTAQCLAHMGSPCTVCVERCPVPGAMSLSSGRPVINAELCSGCGVCQHVCLAPQNAILLLPAARRPSTGEQAA